MVTIKKDGESVSRPEMIAKWHGLFCFVYRDGHPLIDVLYECQASEAFKKALNGGRKIYFDELGHGQIWITIESDKKMNRDFIDPKVLQNKVLAVRLLDDIIEHMSEQIK